MPTASAQLAQCAATEVHWALLRPSPPMLIGNEATWREDAGKLVNTGDLTSQMRASRRWAKLDHEFRLHVPNQTTARIEAQNRSRNHADYKSSTLGLYSKKTRCSSAFSAQHGLDVLVIAQNLDPSLSRWACPDSPSPRLRQDLPPEQLVASLQTPGVQNHLGSVPGSS